MTTIEIVRLVGTEFISVSDGDIDKWVELTTPLVSESKFGALYDQAVALLSCHRMKMAGLGDNDVAGSVGDSIRVGSYGEGSRSIGFTVSQSTNLLSDAELALTVYGIQFLTLRRSVIVPITITSGGAYGRA